jgi:hypothetical protein
MPTIILKLIPSRLTNPDLDLRYLLPDLLAERSGGLIVDDGYEYEDGSDALLIYLRTEDLKRALAAIADLVEGTRVLGNELREGLEVIVPT